MSVNYRNPNFLLPNEVNMATNPDLSVDRHSLYSMEFDGSNYINCGNSINVITSNYSISIWIKFTSTSNLVVCEKGSNDELALQVGGTGSVGKISWFGGPDYQVKIDETINDGEWHHVACVADGSASYMYLDGVLKTTGGSKIQASSNTSDFHIGSRGGSIGLVGSIDELAIWNKALSATEVAALSDSKNSPVNIMAFNPKPIAYYPLGEEARVGGDENPNAGSSEWQFPNQSIQSTVIDFDGSSDYIDAGSSIGIIGTGVKTFSVWLKTSYTGGIQTILSTRDQSANNGWVLQINSTSIQFFNEKNNTNIYTENNPTLTDGVWHNIIIVRGTSTATNAIYQDGSPITLTINTENGTSPQSASNLSIGSTITSASSPRFFDGEMSNIAMWDSNQSSEKDNIYNNGSPATSYTNTPTAWWKLNAANSSYAPFNANFNSALNFDGTDEIAVPQFTLTGALSLSAWIKPDTLTGGQAMLFGDNDSNGYKIEFNGTTTIAIKNAGGNTSFTGAAWNTNKWQHLLITRDASDNVTIYRNGASWSTGTKSGDILFDRISGFNNSASHFDGEISNISVFNTFLNSSAVSALYNNGTPETSISSSPVSWWKLDAGGTTITDYGSGGNNGTNNGATLVSSPVAVEQWVFTDSAGSNDGTSDTLPTSALVRSDLQFESPYSNFSLDFNGIGNYIDCGNDSSLQFSGSFTISAWVKVNDTGTNAVISKDSNASVGNGYHIDFRGGNTVKAWSYNAGSFLQATGLSINTWYNIIFVFESTGGSNGNQSLYINAGTPLTNTVTNFASSTVKNLRIGDSEVISSMEMYGNIDEVAIWDTALTQAQVNQVYNNGLASDLTSLSPTNWWRLGEDAYFVNNNITIPNQITGGTSGTGSGTQTSMLVADAPGSFGSGSGVNLDIVDRIGEAPGTSPVNIGNSQSYNMIPDDRHPYVPGYVPAQVNNVASMAFDGVNDYMLINNSPLDVLDTSGVISISFWYYISNTGTDMVFTQKTTGAFELYKTTDWYLAKSGNVPFSPSQPPVILNEWVHVVLTLPKNAGTANFYQNSVSGGQQLYTGASGSSITIGGFPLNIGRRANNTLFFNGNIDEVAIFDYALTPRQIKEDIYNASTTGKTADLNNNSNLTAPVAWYRMGD